MPALITAVFAVVHTAPDKNGVAIVCQGFILTADADIASAKMTVYPAPGRGLYQPEPDQQYFVEGRVAWTNEAFTIDASRCIPLPRDMNPIAARIIGTGNVLTTTMQGTDVKLVDFTMNL